MRMGMNMSVNDRVGIGDGIIMFVCMLRLFALRSTSDFESGTGQHAVVSVFKVDDNFWKISVFDQRLNAASELGKGVTECGDKHIASRPTYRIQVNVQSKISLSGLHHSADINTSQQTDGLAVSLSAPNAG